MDLLAYHQSLHYRASDQTFFYDHSRDDKPDPRSFKPHYEKGYEVFLFISGSGSYMIEGTKYELEPYSILLMNSNELHAIDISEHEPYERIVLSIRESFSLPFMLSGVDFFRTIKYRDLGHDNQIPPRIVLENGLIDLFGKLSHLLTTANPENEIVAKCVIVQMLSTINRIAETNKTRMKRRSNNKTGAVLAHINANLEEPLSLDVLSEKFYMTKYHLCRTFKETTGFSINQYITYKRIHLADTLMSKGSSPTQACFMSGFNSYSNFFRSYRKLTGKSPRSGHRTRHSGDDND